MKNIKHILLLLAAAFSINDSFADVSQAVLRKYRRNDVFLCVGIHNCVSFAWAERAGFLEFYGIDEDKILVEHGRIVFPKDLVESNRPIKYAMYHGGLETFEKVINSIDKAVTIFLSNHYFGIKQTPVNTILQELDIIKNHPIKNHTILIDDIHYAGMPAFGNITLDDIKNKLLKINPGYTFAFADGGHLEKEVNAILVAYIG